MIDYMNAKGYLKPEEREILYTAARETVPTISGTIVNIGVEYGASMACLRAGNPSAWLIGIDINMSKYIGPRDDRVILIESNSFSALQFWRVGIDLLFVDGDHGYSGVMLDTMWANYVKPSKHAIFQDCYDWDIDPPVPHRVCPGVNRAVSDWKSKWVTDAWTELPHVGSSRVFLRRDL
jgi:hypothetical protein